MTCVNTPHTREVLKNLMARDIAQVLARHTEMTVARRREVLARLTAPEKLEEWLELVIDDEIRDRVKRTGEVPEPLLRLARPEATC